MRYTPESGGYGWCFPDGLDFVIAKGKTSGTHTIRIVGDTREEPDETIVLRTGGFGGGVVFYPTGAFTLTIRDDDGAGATVSTEALTIDEGASSAYTVQLNQKPSADVTVAVSGAAGDVTVDPGALTFTTANYGTARTVTVQAGADEDATEDGAVTLTHAASGGGYDAVTIDSVVVTVTETTPVLQLPAHPAAVTEGADISLTVTSDKVLTGTVLVNLTLAAGVGSDFDGNDLPGGLGPRTFAADFGQRGSRTGTVTIPTSKDSDVEGDETYIVTLNDTAAYEPGADATVKGRLKEGTIPSSPPNRPFNFSAVAGAGQVVLTWSDPGDVSITGYKLSYGKTSERDDATWTLIDGSSAATVTHTVEDLNNDTEYSFQIRAVNGAGDGAPTGWATATPATTVTIKPPWGLRILREVNNRLYLTWGAPTDPHRTGWRVRYRQRIDGNDYTDWSRWIPIPNAATSSHVLTGLAGGNYYVELSATGAGNAVSTSIGTSQYRSNRRLRPPAGLTVGPGSDRLHLNWAPQGSSDRNGWMVRYRRQESGGWGGWGGFAFIRGPYTNRYTLTGLRPSSTYEVELLAERLGDVSAPVRATGSTTAGGGGSLQGVGDGRHREERHRHGAGDRLQGVGPGGDLQRALRRRGHRRPQSRQRRLRQRRRYFVHLRTVRQDEGHPDPHCARRGGRAQRDLHGDHCGGAGQRLAGGLQPGQRHHHGDHRRRRQGRGDGDPHGGER